MRSLQNLPSNIRQFCESIIDLVENDTKKTNLIGFANCVDKGIGENLRRLISVTYLGKHYEIELDYMRRKNGDSLYVRCGDRRLIQYVFNKFVFNENGQIIFKHDGKVHGIRNLPPETIFNEVDALEPSLLIENQAIYLGRFDADTFGDNEKNTFLSSLIKYAIIRSNKRHAIKSTDLNNELMGIENSTVDVLLYKKQIILQGPPGTGKTRLAKQIAQKLIGNNDAIDLSKYLKKGLSIPNSSGTDDYYFLEKVTNNGVELSSEKATKKWSASFNKIQEKLLQLQRGESPANKGGDDPYVLAVAKYVYKNIKHSFDSLENNNQFKLIQFHPSYTYEDFVRGIVAKTNDKGDGILYKAENKILAEFAKKALVSFNESVIPKWKAFRDFLDSWDSTSQEKLYFNDERTIRLLDISYPKEDKAMLRFETWSESTQKWYMQTWISLKDTFSDENYANNFNHVYPSDTITSIYAYFANFVEEKYNTLVSDKFVLIIDEINRANLSSVLGELIYALEYRGEEVESMYELDGSQKLILPPNLYIIGTMNTADRSVGHIDYAIRRRFAFVEVLPKDLSTEMEAGQFYSNLFTAVKSLFTSDDYKTKSDFISQEFEPKDVALGHSYFIDKSEQGGDEKIRWEYEIKPILIEYVRDGVLKQTALQKISEIEESL